ncbi:class I SAM-dependent methyltransferase [Micromonospora sp. NBC_01796]|uniref:class I SAM-dependent methyltransferase n=1 Tax=Micromonospora sp. NBC_01796 TaxID=2975987 RepID=UPI002DD8EF96|nr:class I SAM-dependent methyltransferase [Micromonospora sp. NBC_01796]WSA87276.1 class I SAM-dependent methyltransferase [Micromonospora sp. NBC_01796]
MSTTLPTFDELVTEGASVPVEGWDFSWFAGRATEERPSWGYSRLLADRMSRASAALDLQTGGGEVLATIAQAPPLLVATESWPPNVDVARRNLAPLGARVVAATDRSDLPFRDAAFDLVVSRHPVDTRWPEVTRVLRPGGVFLSQQIGPRTVGELAEVIAGPLPANPRRGTAWIAAEAGAAGLELLDLREESLRTVFHDIGAVVHFLRKVIWIVPGFTVERYRDELAALHRRIEADGPFVAYARRILVEARKPR